MTLTVLTDEWCKCKYEDDGHTNIADIVDLQGSPVFVHARCGRPSFLYWQKYEVYCDDCGRTYSSPVEPLCWSCSFQEFFDRSSDSSPWRSWSWLWDVYNVRYRREVLGVST